MEVRWSCVRFVNRAPANPIASVRPSSSACEETSIAQASSPPSSIARRSACRSIASGVVRCTARSCPPITDLTVPSSPTGARGLHQRADQVGAGRLAVGTRHAEDLQLAGRLAVEARRERRHRGPHRGDPDLGHAEPRARARSRAPQPRSTACAAKAWPSAREARDAEEQRPVADGAGVVGECGDLHRPGPGVLGGALERGGQIAELQTSVPRAVMRPSLVSGPRGSHGTARFGRDAQVGQGEALICPNAGAATVPP